MMYRISCDCRDAAPGRYQGGDRSLVYLAARVGAIVESGVAWVATDGNARAVITRFTTDLHEMAAMIDWPLMRAKMWNSTLEDPDRERRRMAELLVHQQMPLALFHEVDVYSEEHATRVRVALGEYPLAERICVRPQWYYGFERR
jgi:hypothetical protein